MHWCEASDALGTARSKNATLTVAGGWRLTDDSDRVGRGSALVVVGNVKCGSLGLR